MNNALTRAPLDSLSRRISHERFRRKFGALDSPDVGFSRSDIRIEIFPVASVFPRDCRRYCAGPESAPYPSGRPGATNVAQPPLHGQWKILSHYRKVWRAGEFSGFSARCSYKSAGRWLKIFSVVVARENEVTIRMLYA